MKLKKILLGMLIVGLAASNAFAGPERLQIKKSEDRATQNAAKAQIKNIDLRKVTDPEARKALREIMNYLNLQTEG